MEEKTAQTETFVTIFICLYSDFLVPLPKKIFLPFLLLYFLLFWFCCLYLLPEFIFPIIVSQND